MGSSEVFRKELDAARSAGRNVGFVPTMGALHEGHLSLIRRAASECDVTAVSIFVNPLQFDSADDLSNYPRALESDLGAARDAGAELFFVPTVADMYPAGEPPTMVHVGGLSEVLEGASRPGHFDGVATVVAKLFGLAGACRAYFGEKDYQQLLVIRQMVADLFLPVDVVACPTVREPDGLARSSRNARLSAEARRAAPVLYRALSLGAAMIVEGVREVAALHSAMAQTINSEPGAVLDYVEVADPLSLDPLDELAGEARLLVAARFGAVRLIDNLGVVA